MDRLGLRDWLYRIASELHDGPDNHLESKVKEFADEVSRPNEEPANPQPLTVNPNPQPLVGLPHELVQVTEPTPVDPNALTVDDLAKLKALLSKL